ncbi:hypothetical protein KAFR_0B05390 [Kazachstania africana CBS 2517]|uniref:Uncharacterized protein n=1 Tax=Kazachstania africana (strain ATCC 22294 / BCRC 22015 / CBS 2517 / CECT 1963 / NBRC 1671 / NRRL Y-8276) TaxID=1071382 RepID=H2AR34_KAZAF|nr:hypothetical protein KAFR_0B05390 [Kazachstania africana CBS 2517]CCF56834.1 hypothetical protein KAFR_0B05390 [Kazachstania africana CBS 2517]
MEMLNRALEILNSQKCEFLVLIKEDQTLVDSSSLKFTKGFISSTLETHFSYLTSSLINRDNLKTIERNPTYSSSILQNTILDLSKKDILINYLSNAFKFLRQVPCKSIVKLWIKFIEPKKKTKYPYIGGDVTKPSWWPYKVEHKEPDHLQKPDRLELMCYIIVTVLPNINDLELIDDLKKATMALPLFEKDAIRREVLLNIFKISGALCKDTPNDISVLDLSALHKKPSPSRNLQQYCYKNKEQSNGALLKLKCKEKVVENPPLSVCDPHLRYSESVGFNSDVYTSNVDGSSVLLELLKDPQIDYLPYTKESESESHSSFIDAYRLSE